MIVFPLDRRTALLGEGFGLLSLPVLVKYSQTTFLSGLTSTILALPESVIRVLPLESRMANAAVLIPSLYSHTILPPLVISMTRLLFSSAISMCPPLTNNALLGLLSSWTGVTFFGRFLA